MNRTEVGQLLAMIEGFERRGFPESSIDSWLALMAGVDFVDAVQATREHFDSPEPQRLPVQAGQIKRRAIVIRENRLRSEQRAIQAPPAARPPNAEYLRARRRLAERFGNLERAPGPPMRADTSSPTASDSEVTEQARRTALAALANWSVAA